MSTNTGLLVCAVLLSFLGFTAVQDRQDVRSIRESNRLTAELRQAANDAAQVSVSVQAAAAAALENARTGDAEASFTYQSQKQALQNSAGRLRNELRTMPGFADRAATLEQESQLLLENLDELATQTTSPRAAMPDRTQLQARVVAPAMALAQNADSLRADLRSPISSMDEATAAAALDHSQRSFQGMLAVCALALALTFLLVLRSALHQRSRNMRRKAAGLHEAIFRSSPQMILTCGLDGAVQSLNPAAESLFRDTQAAVRARRNHLRDFLVAGEDLRLVRELTHAAPPATHEPNDRILVDALLQHWQTGPESHRTQWPVQFRCSDGSAFPGLATFAPLQDAAGNMLGFFVMAGDLKMTEGAQRRALEIEQQAITHAAHDHQKEAILNATAEGIFGLDPSGATVFANHSAATLLHNKSSAALLSKDLHTLLHRHRPGGLAACAGMCNLFRALQSGELSTSQDTLFVAGGTCIPIEFSASPMLEHGRNIGTVVSVRDISDRNAVDRIKDEFVSTVSHELRTPLTSIRGALGLLNSGLLGNIPEKASNLLRIAVSNTDRLVRLINDVLDIERMDSGSAVLQFRKVDLCELMQQAVDTMRPMADAAGIHIQIAAGKCDCEVDADRILQVFTNLLSNAIKFSSSGSTITLSVSPGEDILSISVSDQGRGVPDGELERVFDRFRQVDSTDSRQKGGSGLGLAICRSILQQHGGRIWAERNFPQGTTLRMVIPRTQAHSTQSTLVQENQPSLPLLEQGAMEPTIFEQTILVCDDDPIARSMVRHHLEQHGYRVIEAESGEQAVGLAHRYVPAAILLDVFMPGMNGWETLQRLKAQPTTADIPVVILSVLSSRPIHNAEDIRGWIKKPFNEQSLLGALGAALNPESGSARILLVENDNDHAALITATFERSGLAVDRARNRAGAVKLCRERKPQLMVLNLSLPDDDGMEIVQWLRQHDELHTMPLLVYSGRDISNAELDLITQGPAQFLAQARVQPAEAAQLVLNLLRRQRDGVEGLLADPPIFVTSDINYHQPIH
jgi:signal transduction histidine kinase/DNA-binding response OmpR family regulator